jgi:tetratricopeptide (TPR) repeat protein
MRWLGLAVAVSLGLGTAANAQNYDMHAPAPRSTSPAVLHDEAVQREIVERFHLGLAAMGQAHYAQATAEFGRILQLHPREPQGSTAEYDLGIAQANSGALDDAAQSFESAIERDPGFLAAMANLVAVDLERHDVHGARSAADAFVAAAPDSARALYSRGLVALQQGDLDTAQSDFSKLLGNDPAYAVAHYDLGIVEERQNDFSAAQREFSAALVLAPSYARARFALGTILLREGNRSDARVAFDRAAVDATDDPSLRGLAIEMRDAIVH